MNKSFGQRLRAIVWKSPIYTILIGFVIFSVFVIYRSQRENPVIDTRTMVVQGTIQNETLVFGKAEPETIYDLAFEIGGKLSSFSLSEGDRVSRGQVLARLDSSSIQANIRRAVASVSVEESRLEDIKTPKRDGELLVQQSQIASAQQTLESSRNQLQAAVVLAESRTRSLVDTYLDLYFQPINRIDELDWYNEDVDLKSGEKRLLEQKYSEITNPLGQSGMSYSELQEEFDLITEYATTYAGFVTYRNTRSNVVEEEQSLMQALKTAVAQEKNTLLQVKLSVDAAEEALRLAQSQLSVADLSVSESTVKVQQSVIQQRQAEVQALYGDLTKYRITSPISGVVFDTRFDRFETVGANQTVVSVIRDEPLVLKANIAESDIAFVGIGSRAQVSFDALPDQIFTARVVNIDARSQIGATVPTYETILEFDENSQIDSVRSGMTANITVISGVMEDVLYVPSSYVYRENGETYVWLVTGVGDARPQLERRTVTVGVTTSTGSSVITSGLEVGQEIARVVN